jgi:hypothetical protein
VAEQFVWMQVLLDRTTTVNDVKKEQIKARLNMFEQLFEESPTIQKIREQYLVKGRQEGLQKGQLLALQNLLVSNVQARYPELVALARISAARTDSLDALNLLVPQVINAPNADAVRGLLDAGTA